MMSRKLVQWSPHEPDLFVTVTDRVTLYRTTVAATAGYSSGSAAPAPLLMSEGASTITAATTATATAADLPPESSYSLLVSKYDSSFTRPISCLDWCPLPQSSKTVGVGLASGKLVIMDMSDDSSALASQFTPDKERLCTSISWNPVHHNLVVTGLDTVRGTHGTLVWDISAGQPACQFGLNEAVKAVSWFPQPAHHNIAVGSALRYLRIYDTRSEPSQKLIFDAHKRSVSGVVFDPFEANQIATFSPEDSIVKVWDIRYQGAPAFSFRSPYHNIQQIAWDPTHRNTLGLLCANDRVIRTFHTLNSDASSSSTVNTSTVAMPPTTSASTTGPTISEVSADENVATMKSTRNFCASEILSHFAWHPKNESKILYITTSGTFDYVDIRPPPLFSMAPTGASVLLPPNQQLARVRSEFPPTFDILYQIKHLAEQGYSCDIKQNLQLFGDSGTQFPELKGVWAWMKHCKDRCESDPQFADVVKKTHLQPATSTSASSSSPTPISNPHPYVGIRSLVCNPEAKMSAQGTQPAESKPKRIFYTSVIRDSIQRLCGWNHLRQTIVKLEEHRQYERAAALALFDLDINRAIQILIRGESLVGRGSDSAMNLGVIALALSGFDDRPNSDWQTSCQALQHSVSNAYVRAMFAFLSSDYSNYSAILDDQGLAIEDKLAFACRFLPDIELRLYVDERLCNSFTIQGNLKGLMVTGLEDKGIELLQRYVDRTGDVQTASLLLAHASPSNSSPYVSKYMHWRESYRQLLDNFSLWHVRAQFDIDRLTINPHQQSSRVSHVSARCNYCNQVISFQTSTQMPLRRGGLISAGHRNASQTARSLSCPKCRRPLPHCCVCLLPLGTIAPDQHQTGRPTTAAPSAVTNRSDWSTSGNDYAHWFTWCQTCRHGGHVKHVTEWFETHKECAVSDCTCQCASLDRM